MFVWSRCILDVMEGREEKRDYLRGERRERGEGRPRSTDTRTQEQHINNINIFSCSSSSSPLSYHHMI